MGNPKAKKASAMQPRVVGVFLLDKAPSASADGVHKRRKEILRQKTVNLLRRNGYLSQGVAQMKTKAVNILVVDDDKNTRAYVAKILSGKNWHVDTAADGQTALLLVKNNSYSAVVLDYRMPGMDGLEVCRRIKEIQPNTREVFLTGYATTKTIFPAFEVGSERVLAKPVNPQVLIHALEKQLAELESP